MKKHFNFLIIIMLLLVLLPIGCAKQAETPVSTQVTATSPGATPTVKESVTITSPTPGGTSAPEATATISTTEPEQGVVRRDPFMAPVGKVEVTYHIPVPDKGNKGLIVDMPPVYTLTGVFGSPKKAYAILSDAETNHIVKQGEKVGGFTLAKVDIKKKLVVLTSAKGTNFTINLQELGQPAGTPGAVPGAVPPGAPPAITPPGGAVPPSGEGGPLGGGIPPGAPPQ